LMQLVFRLPNVERKLPAQFSMIWRMKKNK
jgi:hypothetical protein